MDILDFFFLDEMVAVISSEFQGDKVRDNIRDLMLNT